ncbi:MAG: 50S ribosomal protein L19e [Candidatus Asgardarchaeia archaeon]
MSVRVQRKIVARMLGVGVDRVWIDPSMVDEVSFAARKEELRKLIHDGVIRILPKKGTSRARARVLHEKKKKGRRRRVGSRKGKATSRAPRKLMWMIRIRALRRKLKEMKENGSLDRRYYRKLYIMASSGVFRSIRHMLTYASEHGFLPKERRQ